MNCNTTATAAAGGNNNKCSAENVWTNEKKSIYSKSNDDDDMSKSIINNNKEDNNNNKTVWNKIYELRSRLANDVICDPSPPSSSDDNSNNDNNNNDRDKNNIISSYNFPTFISPFDMSSTSSTNSAISKVGSGGGEVPLIYCDQTASQRPIQSIENYLRDNSMSCYANTHTVRYMFNYYMFCTLVCLFVCSIVLSILCRCKRHDEQFKLFAVIICTV